MTAEGSADRRQDAARPPQAPRRRDTRLGARRPQRTLSNASRPHERPLVVGGDCPSRLMGILNVTPDSFSDGGRFVSESGTVDIGRAVATGTALVAAGADLLDVGGESTRPGYEPVPPSDQIARVVPVIEGLRAAGVTVPISIDTTRATVGSAALAAGADWINDTTAFTEDPELADVAAQAGCPVVLMHRFDPPRPHDHPVDDDIVERLADGLSARIAFAVSRGIAPERIVLDPGIGFGTSQADCLALHRDLEPLFALGHPLLLGTSRKSFLGRLIGRDRPAADRGYATAASSTILALAGVEILRVHDPAAMRDVVTVAYALRG